MCAKVSARRRDANRKETEKQLSRKSKSKSTGEWRAQKTLGENRREKRQRQSLWNSFQLSVRWAERERMLVAGNLIGPHDESLLSPEPSSTATSLSLSQLVEPLWSGASGTAAGATRVLISWLLSAFPLDE